MTVFSLIIINKAGGLVYQREFQPGLRKLSTNDYLVLAGTFHGVHAITRSITPKIPLSTTTSSSHPNTLTGGGHNHQPSTSSILTTHKSTPSVSTSTNTTPSTPTGPSTLTTTTTTTHALPIPGTPVTGLEVLESDKFRLTCFQTLTGTKFLLFTDPLMTSVEPVIGKIYELYADFVMKNPFYQLEMPVRCEAFDRHLGGWLRGRV